MYVNAMETNTYRDLFFIVILNLNAMSENVHSVKCVHFLLPS